MKIACICITYKRPAELATVIECFERQDYPPEQRELIVLDDADQYNQQAGPGWRIVSTAMRFRTVGEKRNASAALVSPDVDAYAVWDDDDIYLPWHLSAAVAALQAGDGADYTIPTAILTCRGGQCFPKPNQYLFHGAWTFTRDAFESVNGYPFIQSGQDQGLLRRFKSHNLRRADPIQIDPRPSYVYRWFDSHSRHLSALGPHGFEILGKHAAKRIGQVLPGWDRDWIALAQSAFNP